MRSDHTYRHEDSAAARADERHRRVQERHLRFPFIPSERSLLNTIDYGPKTITGVPERVKGAGPLR